MTTNYIDLPIYRRNAIVAHAKVSPQDFKRVSKHRWYLDAQGYARRVWYVGGRQSSKRLHQEILGDKPGQVIDHKNQDRLDCRRENLRHVGKSLNAHNTKRVGVYFNSLQNRFYAHCRVEGVRHSLGGHPTRQAAENAVKSFRRERGLV
jgi:hypothetical protein